MTQHQENLNQAREIAAHLLVERFDHKRGIPTRGDEYTDLWPGDRWTEAYLAADEPVLANKAFDAQIRSIRPDGSFPHLMQGSHPRFGLPETRWIDRQYYRYKGNGALQLPNGEWVTKNHAHPTWALGAIALHEDILATNDEECATAFAKDYAPVFIDATAALYKARGTGTGLIVSAHRDETTNNAGELARRIDSDKLPVFDPSINAALVANNDAVRGLALIANVEVPNDLVRRMAATVRATKAYVHNQQASGEPLLPEFVLAAARLGRAGVATAISAENLAAIYEAPSPQATHHERTKLSMAECLEIARLTPGEPESQAYIERIVADIAYGAPITRFEGIVPGKNAASNKLRRKSIWLPSAAQLVMLPH